jgi:hypothetical protein
MPRALGREESGYGGWLNTSAQKFTRLLEAQLALFSPSKLIAAA